MDRTGVERARSRTTTNGDRLDVAQSRSLVALPDEPLIGLPLPDEDGNVTFHYFVDEAAADAAARPFRRARASSLAGAWSDLDWDEMERELDRIRHESIPTPPIEDL